MKRQISQDWFNGIKTDYETPDSIFIPLNNEFCFTLDVASSDTNAKCVNHFTEKENGLVQAWKETCWLNPPYGRSMKNWIKKAYTESRQNGITVVALIPARTNTEWWHKFIQGQAEVRFIRGQVAFKGFSKGLWMPMCLVIWRKLPARL